jgi:hypothetical protein
MKVSMCSALTSDVAKILVFHTLFAFAGGSPRNGRKIYEIAFICYKFPKEFARVPGLIFGLRGRWWSGAGDPPIPLGGPTDALSIGNAHFCMLMPVNEC